MLPKRGLIRAGGFKKGASKNEEIMVSMTHLGHEDGGGLFNFSKFLKTNFLLMEFIIFNYLNTKC